MGKKPKIYIFNLMKALFKLITLIE